MLVSLKAETARQAYQRISIVMLIIWVLPNIAITFLPQTLRDQVVSLLGNVQIWSIIYGLVGILLAADIILVLVCLVRFKRTSLALIL